jgi:hypothetical protein
MLRKDGSDFLYTGWGIIVLIMERLTNVLKFIQTGITTPKGYPPQNVIPEKDTLVIEMMVGTYVL